MDVTLQPVLIASSQDGEGQLVFVEGRLAAILARLSPLHGDQAGCWFLETGLGVLASRQHPSFPSLDAALAWIKESLADNPTGSQPDGPGEQAD